MKLYKLTDENDRTYGGCQWGEGVEHTASGTGDLCGPGWIHAYTDPLLAVFLNSIHGCFDPESYHLWEAEGDIGKTDNGLKVGCTRVRTLCRAEPQRVTPGQHVRFGILCAMRACEDETWRTWAKRWLSGKDRSETAAREVVWAVEAGIAWTVDRAAARAAAWAAGGMAWAAVQEAARAAEAAAQAAGTPLPLAEIAREAVSGGSGGSIQGRCESAGISAGGV